MKNRLIVKYRPLPQEVEVFEDGSEKIKEEPEIEVALDYEVRREVDGEEYICEIGEGCPMWLKQKSFSIITEYPHKDNNNSYHVVYPNMSSHDERLFACEVYRAIFVSENYKAMHQ